MKPSHPAGLTRRAFFTGRAFTLVELLAAVCILATVAALAIPAYGIVKKRTDSAKCLTNLKTLGTALSVHLTDHQMCLPDLIPRRESRAQKSFVIDNTLNSYVDNERVFACPADAKQAVETGTSYDWNPLLSRQQFASLNMAGCTDLSRIVVMVDKEDWHKAGDGKDSTREFEGRTYPYRIEKTNHLFADGHASRELRQLEILSEPPR